MIIFFNWALSYIQRKWNKNFHTHTQTHYACTCTVHAHAYTCVVCVGILRAKWPWRICVWYFHWFSKTHNLYVTVPRTKILVSIDGEFHQEHLVYFAYPSKTLPSSRKLSLTYCGSIKRSPAQEMQQHRISVEKLHSVLRVKVSDLNLYARPGLNNEALA